MNWATVAPSDHAGLLALYEDHFVRYEISGDQRARCRIGLRMLLAWLQPVEGQSWQQVWDSHAETEGAWTSLVVGLRQGERSCLYKATQIILVHRAVRPSYPWLLRHGIGDIYHVLFETTERQARQRLVEAAREIGFGANTLGFVWAFIGRILLHTGKALDDIETGDLLDLRDLARGEHTIAAGHYSVTRLLFHLGIVREPMLSPAYFRTTRPTVDQLVGRFTIRTSSARDAFTLYLKEREPALDYNSLRGLADRLLRLFWCDIEAHHAEVCGLALPAAVAEAWRARVRVLPDGRPRAGVEAVFFAVRAFYLDVQQWALTHPAAWAQHVSPSPVRDSDLASFRKSVLQQRARTHARIRRMQPLLARFAAHVRQRRDAAARLLTAACACRPGETFECDGAAFRREPLRLSVADKRAGAAEPVTVRRVGAPNGKWLNCRLVEDRAFWAWAVTEILRLTGLRCEELIELTHVSIRRYRMVDDREVLLLQIAPSKQDRERVIPVCPELAHALARVVERARGQAPRIPCVPRYDPCERAIGAPLPYLFQGGPKRQRGVFCRESIRALLRNASADAGLVDKDGTPVVFQPHDFRRIVATEAVNNGLPLHIAAKLLGHADLNTTRGYVAVYEEEVIRQFQIHLGRRRAFRPSHEYREPTAAEWAEFEQHFRRRRMALGDCFRPYGTDCPHEHACIRCSQLRVDTAQLPRLREIEADTLRLLAEARQHGWEGETAGLEFTLAHIQGKKIQAERTPAT